MPPIKVSKQARLDFEGRLIGDMNELIEEHWEGFRPHAARMLESHAFFLGKQHVVIKNDALMGPAPSGESVETHNFCLDLVAEYAALMLSEVVDYNVLAPSADTNAQARARATSALLRGLHRSNVVPFIHDYYTALCCQTLGAAWQRTTWDEFGGMPVAAKTEGLAEEIRDPDEFWNDDKFERIGFEGRIHVDFCSPLDVIPNPDAKHIDQVNRIVHLQPITIGELEDRIELDWNGMPVKGRVGTEEHDEGERLEAEHLSDILAIHDRVAAGRRSRSVLMVHIYELPSPRFPFGRYMVKCQRVLLHYGKLPYADLKLPFDLAYGHGVNFGALYPRGLLEAVKGPQRAINRTESKKDELLKKKVNFWMLVPQGADLSTETFSEIPGQKIMYRRPFRPEPMDAGDFPPGLFTHSDQLMQRIERIVGRSDISRGNDVGSSGRNTGFAIVAANRPRAPILTLWRQMKKDVAAKILSRVQQFYDEDRVVRLVGPENDIDIRAFKRNDFSFPAEFEPETFSEEPNSPVAQANFAMEAMGMGFFDDTPQAERARRVAGQGGWLKHAAYDPDAEENARAERENVAFSTATDNPNFAEELDRWSPETWHDHILHMKKHNKVRNGAAWDYWPAWLKLLFNAHCDLHEALLSMRPPLLGGGGEQPGPEGMPPGPESPIDGGAGGFPAPPPTPEQFTQMSPEEQAASDQA